MIGNLWPDSNCWCWGASCLSHAIWMRWSFTRPRASQKASVGFRSTPSQVYIMWFVEHMIWCSYFHINIVLCQYARLSGQGPTGTTQSTLIERRDQIDCHDVSVLQLQWTSRPQRHIRNTLVFFRFASNNRSHCYANITCPMDVCFLNV